MNSLPLWIMNIAKPLSRSCDIDAGVQSIICRSPENDLSQETLPTGKVRKMVRILLIAG